MNFRTVKSGLEIAEVPIRFEERSDGQSKMTLSIQIESALLPWRLLLGRNPS
jgi:dolichol-phosphate mannosyltransferase